MPLSLIAKRERENIILFSVWISNMKTCNYGPLVHLYAFRFNVARLFHSFSTRWFRSFVKRCYRFSISITRRFFLYFYRVHYRDNHRALEMHRFAWNAQWIALIKRRLRWNSIVRREGQKGRKRKKITRELFFWIAISNNNDEWKKLFNN